VTAPADSSTGRSAVFLTRCVLAWAVSDFFDMLVALKGGHPENLTAVAISGPQVGGGDTTAPRIHAFLNLAAPNAYWTDISGTDYSQPLQEALEVIEGSCEGFIPPQG
jgi:hypothetical protein